MRVFSTHLLLFITLLPSLALGYEVSLINNLTDESSHIHNHFGHQVELNDNYAIIAASGSGSINGGACSFKNINQEWSSENCFSVPEQYSNSTQNYAKSIALSEQRLVIGADIDGIGAAFIYEREDEQWQFDQIITQPQSASPADFASSLASDNTHIIIGSPAKGSGNAGYVYIYTLQEQSWVLEATLSADSSKKSGRFGQDIAYQDNYLIIGDSEHGQGKQGASYIYFYDDETWTKQAFLTGGSLTKNALFGSAVAISEQYAVVGSPKESHATKGTDKFLGSVYLYKRRLNNWELMTKLMPDVLEKHDQFGTSLVISDDFVLVGAQGDDNDKGAVYLYKLEDDIWQLDSTTSAEVRAVNDHFGYALSISNGYALISSPDSEHSSGYTGNVYLYSVREIPSLTAAEAEFNELVSTLDLSNPYISDSDGDGLSDKNESTLLNTNPLNDDTDQDGLNDHEEVIYYQSDPLSSDSDGDGLSDLDEAVIYQSSPTSTDTDQDGYSDQYEVMTTKTDPSMADSDSDGYSDVEEIADLGTSPTLADTDGDGLTDAQELELYNTSVLDPDTDNDGFSDGNEINYYETDASDKNSQPESISTSTSYSPSYGQDGTIAFEDEWPNRGDYDFNDAVFNYNIEEYKINGLVKQINYKILPTARGATYTNSLRLLLNVPISNIAQVSITTMGNATQVEPIADKNQTLIVVIADLKDALPANSGSKLTNTLTGSNKVTGKLLRLSVTFNYPVSSEILGAPPYNTFIARQLATSEWVEVHFPGKPATSKASKRQFGRGDDDTQQQGDRFFFSKNNLPWAMHIPEKWHHPKERVDLSNGYPDILNWAQSNGKKHKGWYKSKRKSMFIFEDVPDI
ncbi:hypothetical protein VIOR3934_14452 [Vibrio orientalis CIP 102891 = ATCC 33934]|uniref:Calcium-binding acidic-repeat protein (ARP) n=1 Tax=Vibrio orientalis CIP 102891 = ATCC 33934 TaxID=675816 RepID=C9QGU2_VIBOR|nr:LruC domain-containing protein [Vibrio orientalis]EEX93868.1 calcium-binding acidic-repeat protein precursor (ARP) [Vibrio orientalis CIP 102891 = ATCC 33934]EGU48319.1 hypothetical protein VIOR3934_14452 [Vibrio orientalis CIP 102891 = ATCC 33934]